MKVLLIYPPITLHKLDVSSSVKFVLIGLGYIAGVLQKAGHEVKILDCLVSSGSYYPIDSTFKRSGLSNEQMRDYIKNFAPDVVGISSMFTSYFKDAHNVAGIVKEYNKNILVIFGGAHTSAFPETVMKDSNVDVIVIGEGEITVCELLERYKNKDSFEGVKGIIHRINDRFKKEEPREFIENLDTLPFPARELLENDLEIIERENRDNKFLIRKPVGTILTSRGCPNDCYFCSVKLNWTRRWRARSAKNVVDEIEFLKNRYGYKEFHFVDDNSSVSKPRMHEICDEILQRKLNIKLATPTGIAIGTLDKEILAKMKKAGFYRLCFGIESGDPETQKIIKKRIDLGKARQVIREANKLGFLTSATFIIGFPHETMREIRKTIDFAKVSNMDFMVVYLLTPQPGTEVYTILKEQGLINLDSYIDPYSDEWYKISITYSNGFRNLNFTNKELQGILSQIYKEFIIYKLFSPHTYINIVRKVRSLEDFKYILNLMSIPLDMLWGIIFGERLSNLSMRSSTKRRLENID